MKAIRVTSNGDASVLQIQDVPTPVPGPGEVLVQLQAAGVNFLDIHQRIGRYPISLPYTPGLEGSGIVKELGPDVKDVKIGDRVAYTIKELGSYAEFNVVPAEWLVPLPDDISFEQGAAFLEQGMTAHYLLHDFHRIKLGDNILIHAAAGGVGLLLVQWAKHLGARVIGTVSTDEKAKIAYEAGAEHIIIYTQQDFVAETKKLTNSIGADYIIDSVGKTTFNKDLEAVKMLGHICLFGSASGPADPIAPNSLQAKSLTISGGSLFNHISTREQLLRRSKDILNGIREKWLKLRIDYVLPLEKADEAHRLLEGRKTIGKVILKIGS